jgi:CheY-like chemotaxis protein
MPSSQKHILVVEDDSLMRELEAMILEDAGYRVELAPDGRAALAQVTRERPHLILLDLMMPGMNGWDVLRHLRSLPSPPPVIVASGLAEAVPPGPLSDYVVGYLVKPFRGEALLAMCEEVLAAPLFTPPSGTRKEARRTYVVEATWLSPAGAPLVTGRLLQISQRGCRLQLKCGAQPGDPIFVSFRVPGRDQPLELHGVVRWRDASNLGVELHGLPPSDADMLARLLGSSIDGGDVNAGGELARSRSTLGPGARAGG